MRQIACSAPTESDDVYRGVVQAVGGRLSHLEHISRQRDMLGYTQELLQTETSWLISQIGLLPGPGEGMSEKVRSSWRQIALWCSRRAQARRSLNTWALLHAFVQQLPIEEREVGHRHTVREVSREAQRELVMPQMSYVRQSPLPSYPSVHLSQEECCHIMRNPAHLEGMHAVNAFRVALNIHAIDSELDRANIISMNVSAYTFEVMTIAHPIFVGQ